MGLPSYPQVVAVENDDADDATTFDETALPHPGDELAGWHVDDRPEHAADDRPLVAPDGTMVETWQQDYPYSERLSRREYETTKRSLQIELLKLQTWVKETGQRVVLVFEGRDAAGKGGTIKRFTEHLNPRGARVVARRRRASTWTATPWQRDCPARS